MNIKLKKVSRHLLISFLLVNGYLRFLNLQYTPINLSNALFFMGLIYTIFGLFRITRKLHFFDLTFFGFRKLVEIIFSTKYTKSTSRVGEYNDYLNNNRYEKSVAEFLIPGLVLLCFSLLLVV